MSDNNRRYGAFLLRIWRTDSYGQAIWRASIEDPVSGERRGFTQLADVLPFLEAWAGADPPAAPPAAEDAQIDRCDER